MDKHNHHSFALNDLRRAGKTVYYAESLFCRGLPENGAAFRIMGAAVQGDAALLAKLLSDKSALPDFSNAYGITPLMAAAARGHDEVVELLAAHPLVNAGRASNDGWTALHYAAWFSEEKSAAALIAHHAPLNAATADGATPFDLATGKPVENVFWQDRNFVRHMKLHQPDHPKLQPAPPVEPSAAPQPRQPDAPPAPDTLKDAFFRAIAGVGLQWDILPSASARKELMEKIASMGKDDLKKTYKLIRDTNAPFDWSGVFILAAGQSNIAAMRFLHDEMLFDQRTLNQALSAVIGNGDLRDAAHHLVIWGANPTAPYEINARMEAPDMFDAAFLRQRSGIVEELVLWRGDKLGGADIERYMKAAPLPGDKEQALAAGTLWRKKREMKKLSGEKLKRAFNAAVTGNDPLAMMAAYVEARRDRLFRRNVEISAGDGGGAIAVALLHERYEFARLLVADGYSLNDCPSQLYEALFRHGTQKAKDFATDHLAGRMTIEPVEDVGRAKRSEIHILMYSRPFGAGHYGMF